MTYLIFAGYVVIAAAVAVLMHRVLDWPLFPSLLLAGSAILQIFFTKQGKKGS